MAVVTPTDRPKSVRNCCLIELFVALFVLSLCPFDISVGLGAYVIGSPPFCLHAQWILFFKNQNCRCKFDDLDTHFDNLSKVQTCIDMTFCPSFQLINIKSVSYLRLIKATFWMNNTSVIRYDRTFSKNFGGVKLSFQHCIKWSVYKYFRIYHHPSFMFVNHIYSIKKFCTTHSYFFVFLTSNTYEIKENDRITLKFSEIVFCSHFSCFCKRPVVLRDETGFVKKQPFWPRKCKLE